MNPRLLELKLSEVSSISHSIGCWEELQQSKTIEQATRQEEVLDLVELHVSVFPFPNQN